MSGLTETRSNQGGSGHVVTVWKNAVDDGGLDNTGATDVTTALATFYASVPTNGVAYFPAGTYKGLHAPGKSITVMGDGKHRTTFTPPAAPPATSNFVDFGTSTKCGLYGVKVNANNVTNIARGVSNTGNGNDKHVEVAACWFENFSSTTGASPTSAGSCAIYIWTSDSVVVKDNHFVDCIYPTCFDSPGNDCHAINNKIWCTGSPGISKTGIYFRRTVSAYCGGLIEGNSIENVRSDPGAIGTEGHAINAVRCQGVRIFGNTTRDTQCAGVHLGDGCYGSKIIGNDISEASGAGGAGTASAVYIELNITAADITIGTTGGREACTISGNSIYNSANSGISLSYSAGTIITGNTIFENAQQGIFSDSDRCIIDGNTIYNNFKADAAPLTTSTPNVQAQVRVTTGAQCIITNNEIFENQATPVCDYGIAVKDNNHTITGNRATGVTAPIFETAGGTTNNVSGNPGYNVLSTRLPVAANTTLTNLTAAAIVATTSTAAARTHTLPAANALRQGERILFIDESNAAATNNITISRAGTDTINGGTSAVINTNSGVKTLVTDGTSKWTAF